MTEQQRRPTQAPSRPGPVELCVDRRRSPAWPGQLRLGLPERHMREPSPRPALSPYAGRIDSKPSSWVPETAKYA
jgi:hypothetical protein